MTCVCCNGQSCAQRNCVLTRFSSAVVSISGSAVSVGNLLCNQQYGATWVSKLEELNGTYVAPRVSATQFSLPPPSPLAFGDVSVSVAFSAATGNSPPCSFNAAVTVSKANIFGANDCYTEFYVVGTQGRMCRAPANCVTASGFFPYRLDAVDGSGNALVSACDGSCIESRAFFGAISTNQCASGTEQRCGGSALGAVVASISGIVTVTLVP